MAETSIGVSEKTKKSLEALKDSPRETLEEVIIRPQCAEMIFKPEKGNPHIEPCTRKALPNSKYCKQHQESNKGELQSGSWECGCVMKEGKLTPCERHKGMIKN